MKGIRKIVGVTLVGLLFSCSDDDKTAEVVTPPGPIVKRINYITEADWKYDLYDQNDQGEWVSKGHEENPEESGDITIKKSINGTAKFIGIDGKLPSSTLGEFDSIGITYESNISLNVVIATEGDSTGWVIQSDYQLPKTSGSSNSVMLKRDLFVRTWGKPTDYLSMANTLAFNNDNGAEELQPNCSFDITIKEITLYDDTKK